MLGEQSTQQKQQPFIQEVQEFEEEEVVQEEKKQQVLFEEGVSAISKPMTSSADTIKDTEIGSVKRRKVNDEGLLITQGHNIC